MYLNLAVILLSTSDLTNSQADFTGRSNRIPNVNSNDRGPPVAGILKHLRCCITSVTSLKGIGSEM